MYWIHLWAMLRLMYQVLVSLTRIYHHNNSSLAKLFVPQAATCEWKRGFTISEGVNWMIRKIKMMYMRGPGDNF